jgi:hypothetical protein
LADAIDALASDRALRARLAEGARRTHEAHCSPEAIGRDVLERLKGLIRSPGRVSGSGV